MLTVPTAPCSNSNGADLASRSCKNGKQHMTKVTIGAVYGAQTQITKGLAAGDSRCWSTNRCGPAADRSGTGTGRHAAASAVAASAAAGFGGGGFGGGQAAAPAGGKATRGGSDRTDDRPVQPVIELPT